MATKRMIDTGLVDCRKMRRLNDDSTRLLFFYLNLVCDDDGKLYCDPIDIKAKFFPLHKFTIKDVEKMLLDLAKNGLIVYYKCKKSNEIMASVKDFKTVNNIPFDRYKISNIPCYDSGVHELIVRCENNVEVVKDKKKKKIKYLDSVYLEEGEYEKITENYFGGNKKLTDESIQILNSYKQATGKKYRSDYHAIYNWVVGKMKKDAEIIGKKKKHINIIEWAKGDKHEH